ncbi:hypothetical protein RW110999_057 [Cyanophage S-RIM4]|nr:hypothetical protein RW110999_057 [Cyanophage S-RIM4]
MTVPYYVEYNYQKVKVPQEILYYCDNFTLDADREDLRYIDCVYMNMGYYGNDPAQLRRMREEYTRTIPVFE